MTKITIPELSLVVLIGISGSGKTSFAAKHFLPTEVISSDSCRGMVSDDENDLTATGDAFAVLHYIAAKRLARGRLTVVDATNLKREDREPLRSLARAHDVFPVAIVLDPPVKICQERNRTRPDRNFGGHVIPRQHRLLRRSLKELKREGFRMVHILQSVDEIDQVEIARQALWCNRKDEHGPFDIIGDIHGCYQELVSLLGALGYQVTASAAAPFGIDVQPPAGRKAVFLGDLVDRGPDSPGVLRLVMSMAARDQALCVPGNHDVKLMRKLRGADVQLRHGLAGTLEQLEGEPAGFLGEAAGFIDGLVSHYVLDDGNLVVAHAGMKEAYQGRASGRVRSFALYGETTGESDEFGLPVRYPWADDYRGRAFVIYGHTPVPEPSWVNKTLNIDTGCAFGGNLTALRYPEMEILSVPAARTYSEPIRRFLPQDQAEGGGREPNLLDLDDVSGKRIVHTRLRGNIIVQAERSAAALEVMSRFAVDPRWLIYLPPTMSPTETSSQEGLLEHPDQAFQYYRRRGLPAVICEQKHMGSRAVAIVLRQESAVHSRFGLQEAQPGIIYTRTGRRFFGDAQLEAAILDRLQTALTQAGWWQRFDSDWFCLDCELMPWSAKAQQLLEDQYAAVATAGEVGIRAAVEALETAEKSGSPLESLRQRFEHRLGQLRAYRRAYQRYCWPAASVDDLQLAPFHILASEGSVHSHQDHRWHMATLAELCQADPGLLLATSYQVIDVTDPKSMDQGVRWWEQLTEEGAEGMVVKPLEFIARGARGLVQPAVKCRGKEYLRIIYGPEYDTPQNLARLRSRSTAKKRSLAMREFSLGIEALERFVRAEPLYRVHECVFAILALESEPVDPRL